MSTATISEVNETGTRSNIETAPKDSDPNSLAHIVMVPADQPDETPQAYVMRARFEGFPITALCGFTWVPNKQATGLPVCQPCVDEYQQDGEHRDERDELPEE